MKDNIFETTAIPLQYGFLRNPEGESWRSPSTGLVISDRQIQQMARGFAGERGLRRFLGRHAARGS